MSSAPEFSTASPSLYKTLPDPRYRTNCILPPTFSPSPLKTRHLQGAFLLNNPKEDHPLPKKNERVGITVRFFAQGSKIDYYQATILHIQYIPTAKTASSKAFDMWALFSSANDHSSTNKGLYLIELAADIPEFPVHELWVYFARFPDCGAPTYIHPFDKKTGGDAIMLFSVQFPVGIPPYAILQYGESLPTHISDGLMLLKPELASDIAKLKKNLFPFLLPPVHQYMGGYRLAILSADNLPPTLNDPIH